MDRDLMTWLVDVSTLIVGGMAVVALVVSLRSLRSSRNEHLTALRMMHEQQELAWQRRITLDGHARIYEAAADVVRAFVVFTRLAGDRVQAEGTARADFSYGEDADPTTDQKYAQLLDALGGRINHVVEAHDAALAAVERLWFLIPSDGDGANLLIDLVVVRGVLDAVQPTEQLPIGRGDLGSVLDSHDRRFEVGLAVSLDDLDQPMNRVRFCRRLATRYLTGRIGRFVPPPPIATVTGPPNPATAP